MSDELHLVEERKLVAASCSTAEAEKRNDGQIGQTEILSAIYIFFHLPLATVILMDWSAE